jgi:hypothetical protein
MLPHRGLHCPPYTISLIGKVTNLREQCPDAGRGRYANFSALGDPNLTQEEPIRKWWDEVAELILKEHYYGKQVQNSVEARAKVFDTIMSPFTMVRHISETGEELFDVQSSSIRTGQTDVVQRYGRYYALTEIRWLVALFSDLSRSASHRHGIDAFFGVEEYFFTYTVDDSFLKTRKIWPLS